MKFGMTIHVIPLYLMENRALKSFKIEDGERWQSLKLQNCDISETILPILMKFCTIAHINPPELTSCSLIKLLKIQDGRRPPF